MLLYAFNDPTKVHVSFLPPDMGDYKVRVMLGSELMADEDVQVAVHALDSVYISNV